MADIDVTSTSTNTVDVVGLNDIKAGITLGLVQPFKTEGVNTFEIKPLEIKPLTTTSTNTYDVKPLTTTNTNTYDVKPLKTDSSLAVDLKPAVVDLCLTMNVGKVPSVCIRQPYRHKVGFTLYGVEVWGFSFSGEQETVIEEMAPRPQVAVSGPGAAWPPAGPALPAKAEPHEAHGSGLRIRIGP
jgi:hypothetical protein